METICLCSSAAPTTGDTGSPSAPSWAAPWLCPLNVLVFQLHAPYVSSFDGFDRPWRNLQTYCQDLRVRRIGWDTGFLATGTTATNAASR